MTHIPGHKKKRYGNRKKVKVAPVSGSKPKKVVEKSVSLRGGSGGFTASLNRSNRSTGRSTSYSGNVGQFSSGVRASTTGKKGTRFSASIDKPYQGKPNVSAGVTFKIGKLKNSIMSKMRGFENVARRISKKQRIPIGQARAILASKTRSLPEKTKRNNPNLNRVPG